MSKIYRHADRRLKLINQRMRGEFQRFATLASFDGLNVIVVRERVTQLFDRIDGYVRNQLLEMAREAYRDAEEELHVEPERAQEPTLAYLTVLLANVGRVTEYSYSREWVRKRDRLVESLMVAEGSQATRAALQKALTVLARQVGQTAIDVTDEGRMKLFRDAGIEWVMWITQHDERVCKVCRERDQMRYPIGEVPSKHWRCRCYLVGYKHEDDF